MMEDATPLRHAMQHFVNRVDAGEVRSFATYAQFKELLARPPVVDASFQSRVQPWMDACFGPEVSANKRERNHRFLEEALELVQANGCTKAEALRLVDYVFNRPVGEPAQEVGGVMTTLAALCLACGIDMHGAAEHELTRVWTCIDKIRAKQASKRSIHDPLPGGAPGEGDTVMVREEGEVTFKPVTLPLMQGILDSLGR